MRPTQTPRHPAFINKENIDPNTPWDEYVRLYEEQHRTSVEAVAELNLNSVHEIDRNSFSSFSSVPKTPKKTPNKSIRQLDKETYTGTPMPKTKFVSAVQQTPIATPRRVSDDDVDNFTLKTETVSDKSKLQKKMGKNFEATALQKYEREKKAKSKVRAVQNIQIKSDERNSEARLVDITGTVSKIKRDTVKGNNSARTINSPMIKSLKSVGPSRRIKQDSVLEQEPDWIKDSLIDAVQGALAEKKIQ